MKRIYPQIHYAGGWAECLDGCDCALLITAWPEFRRSALEYKKAISDAPMVDARRILASSEAKKAGLAYLCIGRGAI